MSEEHTSRNRIVIYAVLLGILSTFVGFVVGVIPGMLAYRAAMDAGVFIMEYFLMIVAFCSMWCSSILMSIVTARIDGLTRAKRVGYVALSFAPSALIWIGVGLVSEPIWFRTTGSVVGVILGLSSLFIPFADPSERYLIED